MPNGKRKGTAPLKDGSDTSRAARKRVQNRISQKCHRERQAAHARHLESVVDIIKTGDLDSANANDRYATLLRQHMKIIEEKRQLEEALFRMRKKLLSISNSAAAAADDEAVDALISSGNRAGRQSAQDSASPLPSSSQYNEPMNQEAPMSNDALSSMGSRPQQSLAIDQLSATVGSQDPQLLDLAHGHDMPTPNRSSALPLFSWISDSDQPNALMGNLSEQMTPRGHSNVWSFGVSELDHPFSLASPIKTITVTSAAVFTESMLHACRKHVNLQTLELGDRPVTSRDLATSCAAKEARDMDHVAQISAIGVHILTAFAGVDSYIYGLGAAIIMESLVRWQLMPSLANRASIPEPFRPTPLQCYTKDYPHVIDFINWPDIRDQLILQSQDVNIDEIIRAVVQNTVVDIPQHQMSVNLLSIYYNSNLDTSSHTTWNYNVKTSITDTQWTFLEIPVPQEPDFSYQNGDTSPAESALVEEISRRMDTGSNASSPDEISLPSAVNVTSAPSVTSLPTTTQYLTGSWRATTHQRNEVVTRFGLDQVEKWKLSKDFARKYPVFACSSAVTTYDMVPAQVVLEAEARLAVFTH